MLMSRNHNSGVTFSINGLCNKDYSLEWETPLDKRAKFGWRDHQEATEYGATGIAILLAVRLTEYTTVERSFKGTGFDYYLLSRTDNDVLPFQHAARLEISGIEQGNKKTVLRRVEAKKKQTDRSDNTNLDAFISVVEFNNPMGHFVKNERNYCTT